MNDTDVANTLKWDLLCNDSETIQEFNVKGKELINGNLT